jgi:hypothetical protein
MRPKAAFAFNANHRMQFSFLHKVEKHDVTPTTTCFCGLLEGLLWALLPCNQ